ncbi:fungal-specific transcription factor domain-containing protein [Aspergillus pseudoustus]|uniref:Fungal-specific transcription factor domain-containing protein n=1 Tax=Aspergillus pseudoustus TaxID=1810923 RepID=A0ABR4KFQ0_9EURO
MTSPHQSPPVVSTPSTAPPARKRKLASSKSNHQACLACKGRKIACDGLRPSCSFCSARGIDCVVPPPYKRPKCSQDHVENLEARIIALEHELQLSRASSKAEAPPVGTIPEEVRLPNDASPVPRECDVDGMDLPPGLSISQPEDTALKSSYPILQIAEDEDADDFNDTLATDGMVLYSSGFPVDHGDDDLFTLSASFSFALEIRAASLLRGKFHIRGMQQPVHAQRSRKSSRVSRNSQADEDETTLRASQDLRSLYSMPYRHVSVALLDRFFRIVYPATPYVLEGETRQQFELLWTSNKEPNPLWLAQLNIIFALSCQFSTSRPDRDPLLGDSRAAGEIFYRQARQYIVANASRTTSVPMLQLMLFEINYYQGTGQANECWMTVGAAVRMAQALGLHRKLPQNTPAEPGRQSLYKRLWWGCYYLDRVSSMVYGLPMGIPSIQLHGHGDTIPSPTDDDRISSNPSPHTLFYHTIRLFIIMDEIWSELRQLTLDNQPNNNQSLTILSAIARLDKRLLHWHATLPTDFTFSIDHDDNIENSPEWAQSQIIMLRLRFLAMRINLHRQSLVFLLQSEQNDRSQPSSSPPWPPIFSDVGSVPIRGLAEGQIYPQAEHSLAQISARICISAAQMLICHIGMYRNRQLTGSWWWNLHFIFNSLSVMCASMGLREPHFSIVVTDTHASKLTIRRAFNVLRSMSSQWGEQVVQSDKFLLSLLKTMLRMKGQDLRYIFMDEKHDETAPEYQTMDSEQSPVHNLGLSGSTIPLDFASWQEALTFDPSWALPRQLLTCRDLISPGDCSGKLNSDMWPGLAPGEEGEAHFGLEFGDNQVLFL